MNDIAGLSDFNDTIEAKRLLSAIAFSMCLACYDDDEIARLDRAPG